MVEPSVLRPRVLRMWSAGALSDVARWIATRPERHLEGLAYGGEWLAEADDDGSIFLVLRDASEPGLAVIPGAEGFEVVICDPDDTDSLGFFDTLSEALAGISDWLRWPLKSFPVARDCRVCMAADETSPSATAGAKVLEP